jgi:hypothetical protein
MRDTSNGPDWDFEEEPEFPVTVMIAGIIWIAMGGLLVLSFVAFMAITFLFAAEADKGAVVGVGVCSGLFIGMIGGAFIFVGAQSVRGTAADTLGNGIGSILFALMNWGHGASFTLSGLNILQAVISFLCGIGLLVAGILALVGRGQYKAWRKAQKRVARKPRRSDRA